MESNNKYHKKEKNELNVDIKKDNLLITREKKIKVTYEEFYRRLKYHITFKNSNGDIITEFQNISINSVRFKIIKNGYNTNDDKKTYLFKKTEDHGTDYKTNNDYDYESSNKGPDYISSSVYQIGIDNVVVNNKYKFIGFKVNNKFVKCDSGYSEYKKYIITIEIILDENIKIVVLNNNKYTKLLSEYLGIKTKNSNILYHNLLNKNKLM